MEPFKPKKSELNRALQKCHSQRAADKVAQSPQHGTMSTEPKRVPSSTPNAMKTKPASKQPATTNVEHCRANMHAPEVHGCMPYQLQQTSAGCPAPSLTVLEDRVDQCMARITRQSQDMVDVVVAVHRLNGVLMAARNIEEACQLSSRVSGSPQVLQRMVQVVKDGQPLACIVLNCLIFCTCSPQVLQVLVGLGLIPLLCGQLRNQGTLEPPLVLAALRMLQAMVVGSSSADGWGGHAGSLLPVAAAYLGHPTAACRRLAVQILMEIITSDRRPQLADVSAAIGTALSHAKSQEHDKQLQRDLQTVQHLLQVLIPAKM